SESETEEREELTDPESVQRCVSECEARIEMNPYPKTSKSIKQSLYLPPMGLATQKGRKLKAQQRLRKQAKPVYLESHDET
uniref:Uncharacterized protein n=1 Tax=Astyanax mexicanus TaxID=7994 RepID=W5L8I0_ASTMX